MRSQNYQQSQITLNSSSRGVDSEANETSAEKSDRNTNKLHSPVYRTSFDDGDASGGDPKVIGKERQFGRIVGNTYETSPRVPLDNPHSFGR